MTIVAYLIPISIILALFAFAGFLWTVRSGQYEDPEGDAARILEADDTPLPMSQSATDSPTHLR